MNPGSAACADSRRRHGGHLPTDPPIPDCERIRLDNDTVVCVRTLDSSDRAALARGFQRLSPTSRYRRFFAAKNTHTEADLDFLTRCDGFNHIAVAAFEVSADGRPGDVVGVARFVRPGHALPEAEVAVAVIDEYQQQGLARLLLGRLVHQALDVGVRTLRLQFLAENQPMREFIRLVWPDAAFVTDHGVATARFSIANAAARVESIARENSRPPGRDRFTG